MHNNLADYIENTVIKDVQTKPNLRDKGIGQYLVTRLRSAERLAAHEWMNIETFFYSLGQMMGEKYNYGIEYCRKQRGF